MQSHALLSKYCKVYEIRNPVAFLKLIECNHHKSVQVLTINFDD